MKKLLLLCNIVGVLLGVAFPMLGNSTPLSDFAKGFKRDESSAPFIEIKKVFGYRPAFLVNVDSDERYYGLSRDGLGVAYYDLISKSSPIGWPLGRTVPPCPEDDQTCVPPRWHELRWGAQEVLEDVIVERFESHSAPLHYIYGPGGPGCLRDHPLRYGDLDGNGTKELVLILGDYLHTDLLVFSTEHKRLVFSVPLAVEDAQPVEDTVRIYQDTEKTPVASDPQVWSDIGVNYAHRVHEVLPALRAYAKLYFGDFDEDGHFDIVVWRKQYASRLRDDPIQGFVKQSESWLHYARASGDYQRQETDAETIRGWLAEKGLTWQKGYPSTSECEGQSGQLIPAFHDPLLNDPQVTQ